MVGDEMTYTYRSIFIGEGDKGKGRMLKGRR